MYLSRGGKKTSELCVGCINSSKFQGKIEYLPLNPKATKGTQYYWNVNVRAVSCYVRLVGSCGVYFSLLASRMVTTNLLGILRL